MALGIRRSATQKEIRSAFRRMAKLYHPDQDSSLDAVMRYHEARRAYDALHKRGSAETRQANGSTLHKDKPRRKAANSGNFNSADAETKREHTTSSSAGWYASDRDEYSEYVLEERIPYSLGKTPIIFCKSIIETASFEMFIRVNLYLLMMNTMLSRLDYSRVTSNVLCFCSLIVFSFFRYYHPGTPNYEKSNLSTKFMWSLRYILWVGSSLLLLSPKYNLSSINSWVTVPFEMFIALFLLWAPPVSRRNHHWLF